MDPVMFIAAIIWIVIMFSDRQKSIREKKLEIEAISVEKDQIRDQFRELEGELDNSRAKLHDREMQIGILQQKLYDATENFQSMVAQSTGGMEPKYIKEIDRKGHVTTKEVRIKTAYCPRCEKSIPIGDWEEVDVTPDYSMPLGPPKKTKVHADCRKPSKGLKLPVTNSRTPCKMCQGNGFILMEWERKVCPHCYEEVAEPEVAKVLLKDACVTCGKKGDFRSELGECVTCGTNRERRKTAMGMCGRLMCEEDRLVGSEFCLTHHREHQKSIEWAHNTYRLELQPEQIAPSACFVCGGKVDRTGNCENKPCQECGLHFPIDKMANDVQCDDCNRSVRKDIAKEVGKTWCDPCDRSFSGAYCEHCVKKGTGLSEKDSSFSYSRVEQMVEEPESAQQLQTSEEGESLPKNPGPHAWMDDEDLKALEVGDELIIGKDSQLLGVVKKKGTIYPGR